MTDTSKGGSSSVDSDQESIYDAFRAPSERRMRDLPALVRSAFSLVWRASPRQLSVLAGVQLLAGVGTTAQLLVGTALMSGVLRAERGDLGIGTVMPALVALILTSAALSFMTYIQIEVQRLLGESATRRAHGQILDVAMAVDLEAYDRPKFHDRLVRAQLAATCRATNLVQGITTLLGAALAVGGLIVGLAALAPMLLPLVLFAYIPIWLASVRNSRTTYHFGWNMTAPDRLRNYLAGILSGKHCAQEIRVFGVGPYIRGRYEDLYDERMAEMGRMTRTRLRRSLWASLLGSAVAGGAFVALVGLLLSGHVATAAAIPAAVALQQLRARLASIASGASLIYENSLFLADLNSFFEIAPAVAATRPSAPAPHGFGTLTVDNLSFSYPGTSRRALDGVSFEIETGQIVALVGKNGSGKTTLAKLLCHLYRPSEGRILWDGVDTAECDVAELWRHVAAIFQDFVHYNLSLRENVMLGRHDRVEDALAVERACHEAGVDSFLATLPQRYDTLLGREFEAGAELSIGQWQRVALARAFFRDAPFVIMDEPTAALDAQAEHELFERIREMARGRTVLMISHRLSSVRSADKILVLDRGRLIEQGNHDELMAANGRYASMFGLQANPYLAPVTAPVTAA